MHDLLMMEYLPPSVLYTLGVHLYNMLSCPVDGSGSSTQLSCIANGGLCACVTKTMLPHEPTIILVQLAAAAAAPPNASHC